MRRRVMLAGILAALVAALPARADRAEDDLAAVKKAVADEAQAPAPAASPRRTAEEEPRARPAARASEPKWFRLRIVEKGGKHGRVSVNLPLGIVRAFADKLPLEGCRRCQGGHGPTMGEVLRALDSGQSLVEVDDDEATIRAWVE